MILNTYFNNFKEIIKNILQNIDNNKSIIYIVFFIIYFLLYYSITIPQLAKDSSNNSMFTLIDNLNKKTWFIGLLIIVNIVVLLSFIASLFRFNRNNLHIIIYIFVFALLIFFNILTFSKKIIFISDSVITKYIFIILSSIFYILFVILFLYNIDNDINIEFFIAIEILVLFLLEYILITFINTKKINYQLKNDDFSTITINCFKNNRIEKYSNTDTNDNVNQITEIEAKYGSNYLKTIENIPISFYNDNTKDYQDLVLADFYYPGSYYSYLADSPLNGTPNLEALKISLSDFKTRIIHLDVFSDKSDAYDPNALPIIRCENMKEGATALNFDDTMNLINKFAWNTSYPLFLYLNFNFNKDNENIYIRIYEILLKYFSKYLIDKKYSFSGRNNTFPVSMAKMKDCLGKIIIITNTYPTKTVLDELINCSSNNLDNTFNLDLYKESYITYDKQGLSQDTDKNVVLNNAKSTLNFYYTLPDSSQKNNNQAKAGLYNPSFQDCAQYGIQGTLMYIFVPDDNLNKWNAFFKNKNNLNPVLKDESLRLVNGAKAIIKQQDPVLGLQKPQKYCVIPGMITTEKSNLSSESTNSTC